MSNVEMASVAPIMWTLWLVAIGLAGVALLLGEGVINAHHSGVRARTRIVIPMWIVAGACATVALAIGGIESLNAVQGWS